MAKPAGKPGGAPRLRTGAGPRTQQDASFLIGRLKCALYFKQRPWRTMRPHKLLRTTSARTSRACRAGSAFQVCFAPTKQNKKLFSGNENQVTKRAANMNDFGWSVKDNAPNIGIVAHFSQDFSFEALPRNRSKTGSFGADHVFSIIQI
jgi:hypothetical protein